MPGSGGTHSRSPQRGSSTASGNWARQASVRHLKQRCVVCGSPHVSPRRPPLAATKASTLRGSTSTSTTTAATSTTAAAASTAAATASTTPTTATESPTSATTPTSTATPSASSTASTAAPTVPSTTLAPLALVVAAPPTKSRRSPDLLCLDSSRRVTPASWSTGRGSGHAYCMPVDGDGGLRGATLLVSASTTPLPQSEAATTATETGGGSGGSGGGSGGFGGGGGGSGGSGGSGSGGSGGGRTGAQRGGSGGGQRQRQQRRSETPSPQQLREWLFQRGASGGSGSCPYVIRTGDGAGHEVERPHWAELLRSGVAIFDIDYDAILSAMYALSVSAEDDCYRCVPPAQALHTFTLDSSASRCFFCDNTTLTPLPPLFPVRVADPSGGPVVARSSTVLPCPSVPSGSLSGLHIPSFSTNLVSTAALQDSMVTTTTPGGQRVSICTCTQTGHHLATFTRRPGSSLYTPATEPPQVDTSAQVSASGQVAPPWSCRLLSHQTLLWHHRLGHPSLPRLCGTHSRLLVSGLPRSLRPLLPSPAPPCLPCVEGRQRAAPHSSFPPTTAPLQTLHMDVKGEVPDVLSLRSARSVSSQASGLARTFLSYVCILTEVDVTFDESVPFYCLFPYRSSPPLPPPLFHAPGPRPVDPLPPQGPAPSGVSQVDPLLCVVPVEVAGNSGAAGGAASGGVGPGGADLGGAESEGAGSRGAEHGGAGPEDAEPEGVEPEGVEPWGAASSGGPGGPSPRLSPWPEPLSPQQLCEWVVRRAGLWSGAAEAGATGATGSTGDTGDTGAGGAGVTTEAGGARGAAAAGPGGARTRGIGAAGTGGVGGAGAGEPTEPVGAGTGGARAGSTGVGGDGAGGARAVHSGARAAGVGYCQPPHFLLLLLTLSRPVDIRSVVSLHLVLPLLFALVIAFLVHVLLPSPAHTLWHFVLSSVPLRVPLPAPPESALPAVPDPESDRARAASPTVSRLLATV
ncbi:unnamed protein product [Closterium sp. NIES-54]